MSRKASRVGIDGLSSDELTKLIERARERRKHMLAVERAERVSFSGSEMKILLLLLDHDFVSLDQIMLALYEARDNTQWADRGIIRTWIYRIRRKLAELARRKKAWAEPIITVHYTAGALDGGYSMPEASRRLARDLIRGPVQDAALRRRKPKRKAAEAQAKGAQV